MPWLVPVWGPFLPGRPESLLAAEQRDLLVRGELSQEQVRAPVGIERVIAPGAVGAGRARGGWSCLAP